MYEDDEFKSVTYFSDYTLRAIVAVHLCSSRFEFRDSISTNCHTLKYLILTSCVFLHILIELATYW